MSDSTKNPSAEEEFENIKVFGQTQIEDELVISDKLGEEEPVFIRNEEGEITANNKKIISVGEDGRIPDFDLPESVLAQTIHGYAPGEYASEQVIYKYIIDRDCKLPGSSDNYFLDYDVEAASTFTIDVQVNGSSVGSITETGVDINEGDDFDVIEGDVLTLIAPETPDDDLAGLGFSIILVSNAPTPPVLIENSVPLVGEYYPIVDPVIPMEVHPGDLISVNTNRWIDDPSGAWGHYWDSDTLDYLEVKLQFQASGSSAWNDVTSKYTVTKDELVSSNDNNETGNDPDYGVNVLEYTILSSQIGGKFRTHITAVNDYGKTVYTGDNGGFFEIHEINPFDPEIVEDGEPSIAGTAQFGSTLVGHRGIWNNGVLYKPDSYAYQYKSATTSGGSYSNISGATSLSKTLTESALVGKFIKLEVSATNANGTTTELSEYIGPVLPLLPVKTGDPAITGTVAVGQTLTIGNPTWDSDAKYGTVTNSRVLEYSLDSGENWVSTANTGTSYVIQSGDVGKIFRSRATGTNAAGSTIVYSSATTEVQPVVLTPPVNTVKPVISGTVMQGETISVNTGTWTGSPSSYAYQVSVSNNGVSGFTNISGATSNSFLIGESRVGKYLRYTVTATNADGSTSVNTLATVKVVGLIPVNTVAPVLSGDAEVGSEISVTNGTWDNSPESYNYTYYSSNTSEDPVWVLIGNAEDANSYVIEEQYEGKYIKCDVKANNAVGDATEESNVIGPIDPAPVIPENTSAPDITGTEEVSETLTADPGDWDNEPDTYAYQWYSKTEIASEWDEIVDADESTYVLTGSEEGLVIRVGVIATNGAGSSVEAFSDPTGVIAA